MFYFTQSSPTEELLQQEECLASRQVSPTSHHSFILKKKERTPEEGSRAICQMALVAAIGQTRKRLSTTEIPKPATESGSLPLVPVPIQREEQRADPFDSGVERISFLSRASENEDAESPSEEHGTPVWVFDDTHSQSYSSESKTDVRVSVCCFLIFNHLHIQWQVCFQF